MLERNEEGEYEKHYLSLVCSLKCCLPEVMWSGGKEKKSVIVTLVSAWQKLLGEVSLPFPESNRAGSARRGLGMQTDGRTD